MIRDAGENAPAALEKLCRTYWTPVFAYIRHRGYDAQNAEDLTQSFFASALEDKLFRQANKERGNFRSFLYSCVRHFLSNEWDKTATLKRGGGMKAVYLDGETGGDERSGIAEGMTPELIFDRQYAIAILELALSRTEQEYEARGQGAIFEQLKPLLVGEQDHGSYEGLEKALDMSNGALRVAVHRLRQRYAELLRAEIAETVSYPGEIDAEIQYLLAALGSP